MVFNKWILLVRLLIAIIDHPARREITELDEIKWLRGQQSRRKYLYRTRERVGS